ncbi:MAG: nicotinate-nucleotide adenylyltransferase, partial [Clostridia bacterium]|nr:nicotinate-nucleotide adenylyltransferase [Clostridia bacterium]
MRIGIFGGAFQPPHLGHERALAAFLEETDVALCYVIPTGIPPHKRAEEGVDPVHRLEMARLAFEPLSERVRILDRELFSSEVSYTYLTLEHLMTLHPDGEFYL